MIDNLVSFINRITIKLHKLVNLPHDLPKVENKLTKLPLNIYFEHCQVRLGTTVTLEFPSTND